MEESWAPAASVVGVARRHDLHPNLLTAWRRQARSGSSPASLSRRRGRMMKSALWRSRLRRTGSR
ncbi:transposase [Bradyrhizobium sp. Arg237L]|uniref:transposase n=1 Tax=Bradyrhizobium sp. Arg237L TaxID=3003352 RepID=UPI00249E4B17|nr:transposase [Bradyrhizobium sp. Arg237L]MDI4232579.1 transposase [Bradyrhizobium sp. Arg237L]